MAEQQDNLSLSGLVAIGKDLVATLRDGVLLLVVLLLLVWPQAINRILVAAGFESGSFAGLHWKAKLSETDDNLIRAQAAIADLKEQNDQLSKALAEANAEGGNSGVDAKKIAGLNRLNAQVVASTARVQASVGSSISANAPLVQQIQTATGAADIWGVVYGADRDLDAAAYEVRKIAPQLGLTNAAIYFRQGSYRSVATTTDRVQAERMLSVAKGRREDAYLVNMATWCPQPGDKEGYFACAAP